ncbi:nuclear pore protein 84/107 [Pisolithus orientalis]|uniref:nuclear pore protein 84/107 n=1 Tax=Pisolithus orientalis TaxID=936130 RepID=UPI002223FEFF|nr:nuclear pore protein 84/107 [Pisolithus orientalis]KAI6008883.1 nuclear pore protein 84/107 [Pisolithus orientalis]
MSDSLYAACAEVLTTCQGLKDDLAALLDPSTGFAPRLQHLCRDKIDELERTASADVSQAELDALRMEANTWGLLQALMPSPHHTSTPKPSSHRTHSRPRPPSHRQSCTLHPSCPELVVVREWLHETASTVQHPEVTTGYWKFTKYNRAGTREGLVREMDPDAVNRGDGKTLAADDAAFEKSLAQAIYSFIRAGRLDDAVELCRRAHQPWRAASIRGSLLFQWRAIANEQCDDGLDDEDDAEGWQGNQRRRLWKSTCIRAALNPNLSDPERVVYAALTPTPQTFTVLRSACRTWEDHLWVQISILCEEKQSSEMLKLKGCFWEGALAALEEIPAPLNGADEEEEEEWQKEVTSALETLGGVVVEDGPPADNAFHVSQLAIILNRIQPLLDTFAAGLRDGIYDPDSSEYPTMTRFFAHLCLFLQMIEIYTPPLATQVVLEAYLQVLEAAGQRELIAMYAGALGDNAVERYAMFLTSLDLSADIKERRLALTRAREHGLDVNTVATVTAERTIEKAFEHLPPLRGPLPSIIALQPEPSNVEMLLLRSIEWTSFMEATYDTALEQATVILRYFLGTGRVNLARKLLDMLPPEIAAISEPEDRATEYLHYRQFFNIWELLDRVTECRSLEVSLMNKDTRAEWLRDYKELIEQCYEAIVKLLTEDWMLPEQAADGGVDRRYLEMLRVRQIYVPELILRLHVMLYSSREHIPGNLCVALELANVVADSRYKLYDDFLQPDGRRLGEYLGVVRQAVIAGMESGGSDSFRVLQVGA